MSRGFSLTELLVAMALMMVVTGAIFTTYRYQMFALKGQDIQLETQEAGRGILDLMTREIRMAGYDPTCKWFPPGLVAVVDARPQQLQVQFDLDASGTIDPGESVTYSFDSNAGAIQRTAGGATATLISGMPQSALAFAYYDASGNPLTPSGTPAVLSAAQLALLTRVQVTIQLQRANPYPVNGVPLIAKLASNINLRNRFLNGGTGCGAN